MRTDMVYDGLEAVGNAVLGQHDRTCGRRFAVGGVGLRSRSPLQTCPCSRCDRPESRFHRQSRTLWVACTGAIQVQVGFQEKQRGMRLFKRFVGSAANDADASGQSV